MSLTIGELSLSSGVPIATLRDWDRRHGLSPSQRTIGNHRRYTERDAELVMRVRDLVAGGLRLRAAVPQARHEHGSHAADVGGGGHRAPAAPRLLHGQPHRHHRPTRRARRRAQRVGSPPGDPRPGPAQAGLPRAGGRLDPGASMSPDDTTTEIDRRSTRRERPIRQRFRRCRATR